MLCPSCSCVDSKVVDSRPSDDGSSIRRRRECLRCGARFTTYERIEVMPLMILKKDGSVQPYDKQKLLRSLLTATAKRDIPLSELDVLCQDVERDLRSKRRTEITSTELGNSVLSHLMDLDKVAYVRFASVYKDFKDLDEFASELMKFSENNN